MKDLNILEYTLNTMCVENVQHVMYILDIWNYISYDRIIICIKL